MDIAVLTFIHFTYANEVRYIMSMDAAIWHPNMKLWIINFKSILAKYKCLNAIMKKLYPKYFFFATLQLPKVLLKRISFLLQMTMLTFSNTIQIWNLSVIFERNKTKLLCCIFKFWMIKFKPCNAFKDKIWSLLTILSCDIT